MFFILLRTFYVFDVDEQGICGETLTFQRNVIMDTVELKQILDDITAKLDELLEILSSSSAVKENFL